MKDFNETIDYSSENVAMKLEQVPIAVMCRHKEVLKIERTMKRTIDIIGGLIGVLILIPLIVCVFIINRINHDKGPIFYNQERIGKNGKKFKMYKFRTMVVDADKRLTELLEKDEEARKEWEENRKLKNDPRITKIGSFLRKTSLDEWPQFVNVLIRKYEYCRTKSSY